jgi:hypothetical protein
VLENFHLASSFEIMQEINILENFTKKEAKHIREIIIKAVLATDMAKHHAVFEFLK